MNWWENAVIYQIYPKSFADSNQDGIGDIKGITKHLDDLQALGVNTLWLNPIFLSPQVDNGYDVSDYYQIDPTFGTMEEVEEMIDEAHRRNMKVLFDLVLNHTSSAHPWFQAALKDKNSPYRDFYYFEDDKPNNWGSFFGGSVWEQTEDGSYYFHLFDKDMPDLNWTNPSVRQAMVEVAKFWAKKGVDGFRLDAFIHMAKDDFSKQGKPETQDIVVAEEYFANLPEVQMYLKAFRQALDEAFPNLFYLGEASSANLSLALDYIHPDHCECDAVVTFRYFEEHDQVVDTHLPTRFQPKQLNWQHFAQTMDEWQEAMNDIGYPTLYWNNHDMARLISRFGEEKYESSQKALATLMYLQKGIPIILYGEELGMKDWRASDINQIPEDGAEDFYHQALALGYDKDYILEMMSHQSRNASRGMMPWTTQTENEWLGGIQPCTQSYSDQMKNKDSMWHFYKELLALKQTPLFTQGSYKRLSMTPYAYERQFEQEMADVVVNLEKTPLTFDIAEGSECLLLQNGLKEGRTITLYPYGSVVIKGEYYE